MKAIRHAEIARPPSELLEAVARVHEQFIIAPAVLSDEGRIFRISTGGGGTEPLRDTIRIAPAGHGRSVVDLRVEQNVGGLMDRLFNSAGLREDLERIADDLIAALERGDLRPDPVKQARGEALIRDTNEKMAKREAESPTFAKMMAEARSATDRAFAQHPATVSIEVLTLDGEPRYKNSVIITIPRDAI